MAMIVRRARREDADFLAWVMLFASRSHLNSGAWDLLVGTGESDCLEYLRRLAVSELRSLCHYESFWVAEVDGEPGAALSDFDRRAGGWALAGQVMSNVQRDLGWTEADLAASQERAAPVWACFLSDIGADWGIEHVATRPEYRRRGLAAALMNRALFEGRERGCQLAQITTFIGNDVAQSLYKRFGFRLSEEKRCNEMESVLGTPGFARLILEL